MDLFARFIEYWLWVKTLLVQIIIYLYRRKTKKRLDLYDVYTITDPYKIALLTPPEEWKLELPRSENYLVTDEIFFCGLNMQGDRFVVQIAKACSGRSDVWIYLRLANGKCFFHTVSGIYKKSPKCFRAGGLLVECLHPMRRWRIVYNGLLTSADNVDNEVHVKFNFLWFALSTPFDFLHDIPASLAAENCTRDEYTSIPSHIFRKSLEDRYEQSGQLKGTINIEGEKEGIEEYLWGVRARSTVLCSTLQENKCFRFIGYSKDGSVFSLVIDFSKPYLPLLHCGYVAPHTSISLPIRSGIVQVPSDESVPHRMLNVKFLADKYYDMLIHLRENNNTLQREVGYEGRVILWSADFAANGEEGKGLVFIENTTTSADKLDEVLGIYEKAQQFDVYPPVVSLSEFSCKSVKVAGGKGASLAELTDISNTENEFSVPNGLVVTCFCYREFLHRYRHLESAIDFLQDVAWGKTEGILKETCEMVENAIRTSDMPKDILYAISAKLAYMYGDALEDTKFAVRSSAIGEDSEEMSAAGQMETYLGVKGLQEIVEAVKKCWSSQFGIVAVTYKKNNGQILNSDMAVVIQEMVPSEVSGVMFTCDPVSYNPRFITVSANYGLGETVVSAQSEPDTITLERKAGRELIISSKELGSKKAATFLKEDGGTMTSTNENADNKHKCSLTEEQILRLGTVGTLVDQYFDSPRDIEWALVGEKVYLLQCRPVTSIYNETKFELSHEMDIGQYTDSEYVTNANVGEVLPGASTHLTITFVLPLFYSSVQQWQQKVDGPFSVPFFPYFRKGGTMAFNQAFNSLTEGMIKATKKEQQSIFTKAVMVGVFGHLIENEDLNELCSKRQGHESAWHDVYRNLQLLKIMFKCKNVIESRRKKYWKRKYPVGSLTTAADTFADIKRHLTAFHENFEALVYGSASSLVSNMMMLIFLSKGKELDCGVFTEFADLLSSNETIESADVPKALKKLSMVIASCIDRDEFKSMKPEEALRWLEEMPTEASKEFKKYLEIHGHRSYKEYDLRTVSWSQSPVNLVKVLQRMMDIGTSAPNAMQQESKPKNIGDMSTKFGLIEKLLLRLILPYARKAVGYREQGKSIFVKHLDAYRKLFHHLAAVTVSEGYLPEKDLLFFLTFEEIEQLLATRSARLVYKAKQRQKLHPELDKMKFPEIMKGIIKPINETKLVYQNGVSSVKLKGTPVCQGSVRGKARVAVTLQEADELQPGEILITYCTDIAWSPYFPLLSGIVTEIGGLCSHGAVIARECNLPCLVGVTGATTAFATGDEVFLDAQNGTIRRIDKTAQDVDV